MVEAQRIKRRFTTYENKSARFKIDASDMKKNWAYRQYCETYNARVAALKERVLKNAKRMISDSVKLSSLENIAEDAEHNTEPIFVIGTIIKHVSTRPSILKVFADDYASDNEDEADVTKINSLATNTDYIEFEDENQIVKVKGNIAIDDVATGCTCGLYGVQMTGGVFDVHTIVWPFPAIQAPLPTIENEPVVVFMSGLGFKGDPSRDTTSLAAFSLFTQWISGQFGHESADAANVVRVVISGESIDVAAEAHEFASKAAYLVRNEEPPSVGGIRLLDEYLAKLVALVPVDLMPGEGDPTTAFMPQAPIHKAALPMTRIHGGMLNPTTNPYECNIANLDFLCLSGQTVSDIRRLTKKQSATEIMQLMLMWQHMAPTCPDTVDGFPFSERDPFSIDTFPHVFVVGNQPKPESASYCGFKDRTTLLLAVPRFSQSQMVALLNLRTMKVTWKMFSV